MTDDVKLPEPDLHDGVVLDGRGRYLSTDDGYAAATVRRLIAEAVPNAVAAELERVANEPPVNGNNLAMVRVLMAATAIRNRSNA